MMTCSMQERKFGNDDRAALGYHQDGGIVNADSGFENDSSWAWRKIGVDGYGTATQSFDGNRSYRLRNQSATGVLSNWTNYASPSGPQRDLEASARLKLESTSHGGVVVVGAVHRVVSYPATNCGLTRYDTARSQHGRHTDGHPDIGPWTTLESTSFTPAAVTGWQLITLGDFSLPNPPNSTQASDVALIINSQIVDGSNTYVYSWFDRAEVVEQ